MQAARSRGGKKYVQRDPATLGAAPRSLAELTETLGEAIRDLRAGRLDPKQAQALAALAREQRDILKAQHPEAEDDIDRMTDAELRAELAKPLYPLSVVRDDGAAS